MQLVVSKWELTHQSPDIEIVDVTEQLMALFHISEQGLKRCKEIQRKPPLPIEQISEHKD